MKREQIIEILMIVDKYHYCLDSDIERYADAILALPIDIPSEEEIKNQFSDPRDEDYERWSINAAKWFREQVIERNQK
jgi:hypothetical protein